MRLATLVVALLFVPAWAGADLITIPITAFNGTERVARFEVNVRWPLPYLESGATFISYSGLFASVGSPNFLGLAGTGVLRIHFFPAVTRVGFRLGNEVNPSLSAVAQAFTDWNYDAKEPIGQVHLGGLGQFGRADFAFQSDVPFTRLDLAFTTGTAHGSFWIDDFRLDATPAADIDTDGLPDFWEARYGLNPTSAAGDDGAGGDPDHDGLPNGGELHGRTHPKGAFTRFFAEGANNSLFDTQLALMNPDASESSHVLLRCQTGTGVTVPYSVLIPPRGRRTVIVDRLLGLNPAEFATVIESDVAVVADRTMTWDARAYGAHAETSILATSNEWYLAEGATHSGFQLFYLLQNPRAIAANVEVEYLLPPPTPPIVRQYVVPANSRYNIWVNTDPQLVSTDVSANIWSDSDIIVERAMYRDGPGQAFAMGHAGAALTAPAMDWFLAEGATGRYFDTFVLVANPGDTTADLTASFLKPNGSVIERRFEVSGKSRYTIWIDQEDPALADTAVSTSIHSNNGVPVLVERSMWWPGPTAFTWTEAHASAGATTTGTLWGLAEGDQGGPHAIETYILVANTSDHDGLAKVTLLLESGTTLEKTYPLKPRSRMDVPVGAPEALGGFGPAVALQRFGALVESLPTGGQPAAQIVVERAMYSNADGITWAAGTNALATKLR